MSLQGLRPRIVVLAENNPYHADVRVWPHAEALAEAGCEVTVISPREAGGRDSKWMETVCGVRLYRFLNPANGTGAANYVLEFTVATLVISLLTLWVWLRHGMDVLLMFNPPDSLFVAALLPKLAGKKLVYDVRDLGPELYQSKFEDRVNPLLLRGLLWLERRSARLADHITTVNHSYRQRISERDGVPLERITVIRQGPNLKRVHLTKPVPELRERAGVVFAYLGQMAKQDGIDHFFEALKHFEDDLGYTNWYAVLIGPADDLQGLQQMAAELGIAQRVHFTGYLRAQDWVPLVSTADICVEPCPANPLNEISTMNKLMDYMALSKPIVAYDLREHRITAGDAALYARPNDTRDLARHFALLAEQPGLRQRLGDIGRRRVDDCLAWRHQKRILLEAYSQLTGHPLAVPDPQPGMQDTYQ